MKVIYDQDSDTLSLIFREVSIAESDELREGIIVDYASDGKAVSIEFLDASKYVSEPKSILYELKETKAGVAEEQKAYDKKSNKRDSK